MGHDYNSNTETITRSNCELTQRAMGGMSFSLNCRVPGVSLSMVELNHAIIFSPAHFWHYAGSVLLITEFWASTSNCCTEAT